MTLSAFQLSEPLVTAMVSLLSGNLNVTIDQLNATLDGTYPDNQPGGPFKVPHVVQFLPYVPVPSTLEGGMPCVGVQELGGQFENDIEVSADAVHTYAVVAICQHVDHQTLAWQLRRIMQAIGFTIQADRLAGTASGTGGIMRSQAGAFSVNLIRYEPGPLLADLDPTGADSPPRSYVSWVALEMQSMRAEQIPGF